MQEAGEDEALVAAMALAVEEARAGAAFGDLPIGAVVLAPDSSVLTQAHESCQRLGDPTAHASVLALRAAAARLGSWRLPGTTLVTTLEPCALCAGAALASRVARVAFGASDPVLGAVGSRYHLGADPRLNHEFVVVAGVLGDACRALGAEGGARP